jgi:hypothetical protein
MNMIATWLDNPLFVKHLRSRLRRAQFVPPAVIVGVICICISYAGYQLSWFKNGWAFGCLLTVQGILLTIMGASQVASAVGGARESGILDFHRVSPVPPLAVTLGFFFGAPIREYALVGMTLPFTLICAADDSPAPRGVLESMVVLLLTSWILHALALLLSLSSKKPKAGTRGIIGIMIFLFVIGNSGRSWRLGRAVSFLAETATSQFYFLELPWLVAVLIYGLPVLFFLMLASVRKMRSERAHLLTKPQAIACMATFSFLLLGGLFGQADDPVPTLLPVYMLAAFACVLMMTITPNLGEFTKGARRAEREGRRSIRWTSDMGLNRTAVFILSAFVLIVPTTAWYFIEAAVPFQAQVWQSEAPNYSISIATAVLTVAYFGLALQFFLLMAPKRGTSLMGMFILAIWILPLVFGSILSVSGAASEFSSFVVSLSPVVGIAKSSNVVWQSGTTALQGAALCPALVFALLFNNAVTWARRRAIDQIHRSQKAVMPQEDPELVAMVETS